MYMEENDNDTSAPLAHEGERIDKEESKRAPKRRGNKKARKKGGKLRVSDVSTILELHKKDVPINIIARSIDASPSTVTRALQRFEPMFKELGNIEEYRQVRVGILDALELQTVKSLADPEKHASANLYQASVAFREIHKARRLEQGLSTQNNATSIQFVNVDLGRFKPGT